MKFKYDQRVKVIHEFFKTTNEIPLARVKSFRDASAATGWTGKTVEYKIALNSDNTEHWIKEEFLGEV